jgi:Tol biopolymer transport system component
MKRLSMLVSLTAALLLSTVISWAQSGYDLYQKALVKERAVGNVEEAIRLYQRVVKEFNQDHALAAKAQLRLGLLYERLGRKTEAQRALQAVLSQYPDQTGVVRQAKARIARLGVPAKNNLASNGQSTVPSVRQLWAGPNVDSLGKPFPDGKLFCFTEWDTGNIAVREMATGKTRRLTDKGSWYQSSAFGMMPVPSPDGRQVAYYWYGKDGKEELHLSRVDGSQIQVLFREDGETAEAYPVQWSPDGRQILAYTIDKKDQLRHLVLISVADGSTRKLKSLGWRGPLKISLSPDGRYIAYDLPAQEESDAGDIYVLTADRSRETAVVQHPAYDFLLGWTPDGKSLLFASDRAGSWSAWLQRVTDGKAQGAPELVKAELGLVSPMDFTRDGSYYYGLTTGTQDVYTATIDWATGKFAASPAPVSQSHVGFNQWPEWSRDGKYLAYVTRRGLMSGDLGWQILSIYSAETGKTRQLQFRQMHYINWLRWSPDGRSILAVGGDRKNRYGIFRIAVDSGEITLLVQNSQDTGYWKPAWLPDGKAIIYQSTGRSYRYLLRELESGQEKEIYRSDQPFSSAKPDLSPDGRQVALGLYDEAAKKTTIRLIPINGGEARDLFVLTQDPKEKAPAYVEGLTWTPDGREVLMVIRGAKAQDSASKIWRLSAEGGQPRPTELTAEWMSQLRIHPDGRQVTFTAGRLQFEVWVMENFLKAAAVPKTSVSRR